MFRIYEQRRFTSNIQIPLTTGRDVGRPPVLHSTPFTPSNSPVVVLSTPSNPSTLSNSPLVRSNSNFFQKPMIANVSQARGGCGSCGGSR